MNSTPKVRPAARGFSRPYLSLDQQLMRNGIERIISESGAYFSKPLDSSRIVLFTSEGATPQEPPISEVASFFDLIDESSVRVDIHLEVSMTTPHGMFKVGKIYKPFNTYDPLTTIPPQVKKWFDDYEIGDEPQP